MSKDKSNPQMCQDISIFHTNSYNVHRSLKRREGVYTDNTQSLTSKIIFHFCLSSCEARRPVPQHPKVDFLCDTLHKKEGLCVASCTQTATVVTSLSEEKSCSWGDRTITIILLILTATNGHYKQCQMCCKEMSWRHLSRRNQVVKL